MRIDAAHYIFFSVFAYFLFLCVFLVRTFCCSFAYIFGWLDVCNVRSRTFQWIVLITYKNWHSTSLAWEEKIYTKKKKTKNISNWWLCVRERVTDEKNKRERDTEIFFGIWRHASVNCWRSFGVSSSFCFLTLFSVVNLPLIIRVWDQCLRHYYALVKLYLFRGARIFSAWENRDRIELSHTWRIHLYLLFGIPIAHSTNNNVDIVVLDKCEYSIESISWQCTVGYRLIHLFFQSMYVVIGYQSVSIASEDTHVLVHHRITPFSSR